MCPFATNRTPKLIVSDLCGVVATTQPYTPFNVDIRDCTETAETSTLRVHHTQTSTYVATAVTFDSEPFVAIPLRAPPCSHTSWSLAATTPPPNLTWWPAPFQPFCAPLQPLELLPAYHQHLLRPALVSAHFLPLFLLPQLRLHTTHRAHRMPHTPRLLAAPQGPTIRPPLLRQRQLLLLHPTCGFGGRPPKNTNCGFRPAIPQLRA